MYNIIISCFSLHRIALLYNTDAVSVLRENGFLEVYAIKKLIKKLIKKICSGISVGCVAFVAIIFIFPLFEGGANAFFRQKTGEGWQQLAAYCIIIATGFSVPTLIYESSRLSFRLKILIHLTAGALIYLITAHFSGWIKTRPDAAALFLLISSAIAAFPALHAFLSAKRRAK